MKKLAGLLAALLFLVSIPVFASEPVLPDRHYGFTKQDNSPQLAQILPRATVQAYGNVTVYSTVGTVSQQNLERWSLIPDLWVRTIGWYWIDQIPKQFKVIMVSEADFVRLFPSNANTGGLFNYPNEVWSRGFYRGDMLVIHELLHWVLSWIYRINNDFANTRLPGYSPLIVSAGELATNQLNSELGPNPNPMVIDPVRFNRLWEITKQIMHWVGFIGLERVPTPRVEDICQGCGYGDVSRLLYERWQAYNGTGEIYLGITMFSAILDFYNYHRDRTGIYTLAVCNLKNTLNIEAGYLGGDGEWTLLESGQFVGCQFNI